MLRTVCRSSRTCGNSNSAKASFFAGLEDKTVQELNRIQHSSCYPTHSVVLMEGQAPRGVYIVCQGRVKLMTTNSDGKTLIVKIAGPGEVLGLQSVVMDKPYELTAETLQPTQLAFVARDQFLRFLRTHGDACLRATQHLSGDCHSAYRNDPVHWAGALGGRQAGAAAHPVVIGRADKRWRCAHENDADARRVGAADRLVRERQ